jgi:UDP-N-acetyl-D-mannosaminuronic acid dehydrogenase
VRTTIPIGTTRKLADTIRDRGGRLLVAACPDRSVAGRSFQEQSSVPTIVGGVDAKSTRAAAELFMQLGPVVGVASPETAEAIKLFCNTQRDITFAIANQFALICENLGLDFDEIRRAGTHMYPRFSLARPGPVGGDCLSKDSFLLGHSAGDTPDPLPLVFAARRLNLSLIDFVATAVCAHVCKTAPSRPVIAVLGLAFKGEPTTTDQRQSFGIAFAEAISMRLPNADVRTWDPSPAAGDDNEVPENTVGAADVVVLANDHPALSRIDLRRTAALLRQGGLIYDVCGRDLNGSGPLPNDVAFHSFGRCFQGP